MSIADYVREDKQFRKDLDEILQRIKGSSRKSRERSLVITFLEMVIMWLGMDLKALGPTVAADPFAAARSAYYAYAEVTGNRNYKGDPMPKFEDLPENIQQAWAAAAGTRIGNPYPQSYNPDSPVVEQTADGLKL